MIKDHTRFCLGSACTLATSCHWEWTGNHGGHETLLFQKNPKGVWIQNWETVVKVWLLHINQLQRGLEGHNLNPYGPYKYPALAMYGWPCHPHLVMKSHGSVDEWHRLTTVQSSAHSKCCGAICEIGPDSKNARICSNPISAFACNLTVQKNRGSKDETGNQENLKPPSAARNPENSCGYRHLTLIPWFLPKLQYLVVKVPPNKNYCSWYLQWPPQKREK